METSTPADAQPSPGRQALVDRPRGAGLTRDYTRLPDVEAEIASLPPVDDEAFQQAVEHAKAVETVVHAIRRRLRAGDAVGAKALGPLLVAKCAHTIVRAAWARLPESANNRRDLEQDLLERVLRKVYDTSPAAEFWEVFFHSAVIRAAYSLVKPMLLPEGVHLESIDVSEHEDDRHTVDEPRAADDVAGDADREMVMEEALQQLEGDIRLTVFLKLKGLKESSNDPSQPTIAGILNVTDRTVRNHLKKAKAILGPWLRARGVSLPDAPRP